jgi:hypothetical protein
LKLGMADFASRSGHAHDLGRPQGLLLKLYALRCAVDEEIGSKAMVAGGNGFYGVGHHVSRDYFRTAFLITNCFSGQPNLFATDFGNSQRSWFPSIVRALRSAAIATACGRSMNLRTLR